MRDRLLLVGEDYGHSAVQYHRDVYALTGASGRRLAELAGFDGGTAMFKYMLACERTNVVEWPEHWRTKDRVREGVRAVLNEMAGRRTILMGSKVRAAFLLEDLHYFEWRPLAGGQVAVMPHPSGRSRYWNVPENVAAAREFFTAAVAAV